MPVLVSPRRSDRSPLPRRTTPRPPRPRPTPRRIAPPPRRPQIRLFKPRPAIRNRHHVIHLGAHVGPRHEGFVLHRDSQPVDSQASGHQWRQTRKRAGVEGLRSHDLRHAFASMLVSAGCSVKAVSTALGHASAATTLRTSADRHVLLAHGGQRCRGADLLSWWPTAKFPTRRLHEPPYPLGSLTSIRTFGPATRTASGTPWTWRWLRGLRTH
jgi:integrase